MANRASYEENIQQLEGIVRRMETGDLSLEEGLALFEQGIKLIKTCQKQLEKASERIQILTQDGEIAELADTGEEN